MKKLTIFNLVWCAALTAVFGLFLRAHAPSGLLGIAPNISTGTNPMWTVATWYVDPANTSTHASDSNDCQTSGTPCLTLGQIGARFGTNFPTLAQVTTVNLLSDDTVSDPFLIIPQLPDTASSGGALIINGTLVQVGTATIGTFTQRNRSSGTPNTITANGQSGAFWTPFVNRLVHDTTANAWFWVQSDSGSATAVISEPMQSAVGASASPPAYQTIANGDALVIFRGTNLYYPRQQAARSFGAVLGGSTFAGITVNHVNFIGSTTIIDVESTANECSINVAIVALSNRSWALSNSDSVTGIQGIVAVWGGIQGGTPSYTRSENNPSLLDGDVMVTGHFHTSTGVSLILGRVFFGSGAQLKDNTQPSVINLLPQSYGDCFMWGTGSIDIANGSRLLIGTTVSTSMLLVPTIQGQTTARPFTAGAFGSAVTINASNITTNGNLQDPGSGSSIQVQLLN